MDDRFQIFFNLVHSKQLKLLVRSPINLIRVGNFPIYFLLKAQTIHVTLLNRKLFLFNTDNQSGVCGTRNTAKVMNTGHNKVCPFS